MTATQWKRCLPCITGLALLFFLYADTALAGGGAGGGGVTSVTVPASAPLVLLLASVVALAGRFMHKRLATRSQSASQLRSKPKSALRR